MPSTTPTTRASGRHSGSGTAGVTTPTRRTGRRSSSSWTSGRRFPRRRPLPRRRRRWRRPRSRRTSSSSARARTRSAARARWPAKKLPATFFACKIPDCKLGKSETAVLAGAKPIKQVGTATGELFGHWCPKPLSSTHSGTQNHCLPLTLVPKTTVIHSHSEWGPEAHTVVPLPLSGWPEGHTPTESGGRGATLGVGVKALSVVWLLCCCTYSSACCRSFSLFRAC